MATYPVTPSGEPPPAGTMPGLYGPNRDGLLDPSKATPEDRRTKGTDRLTEELADSQVLSPTIKALRAASAKALADAGKTPKTPPH